MTGSTPFLQQWPNTSFGVGLGFGGFAVMMRAVSAHAPFGAAGFGALADASRALCLAVLGAFSGVYLLKLRRFPREVRAEWVHAERANFFFAPSVMATMVGIASGPRAARAGLRALFGAAFAVQGALNLVMYHRWMYGYDDRGALSRASPTYLLAVIGWFLLAVLGERCGVAEASGAELTLFAFGVGALFLAIAYVSVFQAFSLPAAPTPNAKSGSSTPLASATPQRSPSTASRNHPITASRYVGDARESAPRSSYLRRDCLLYTSPSPRD